MFVVIGASGFLGSYIIKNLVSKTKGKIIAVSRNCKEIQVQFMSKTERIQWYECDVCDDLKMQSLVKEIKPKSTILYLAAYMGPDQVEKNKRDAWNVNVVALAKLINLLRDLDVKFFFSSSDVVFGESHNNYHYKETDRLNPNNEYGRMKAVSEAIVLYSGHNIVRFSYLFGSSIISGEHTFCDYLIKDLKNNKPIEMLVNSKRSSIGCDQAASLLVELCNCKKDKIPPVVHICGDQEISKYDIGVKLARKLGCEENLIIPVVMSDCKKFYYAKRSESIFMDNKLLKSILGIDKIIFDI